MTVEQERSKLITFLERAIEPHASVTEIGAKRQAQFLSAASLILALVSILGLLITVPLALSRILINGSPIIPAFSILVVISLGAYWLSRTPNHLVGSVILTGGVSIVGLWLSGHGEPLTMALLSTIPLAFIVGSVLLPLWGMIILVAADILATLTLPLQNPNTNFRDAITTSSMLAAIGIFIMITVVFRNSLESRRLKDVIDANWKLRDLRDSLEKRVEERTSQVRIAAEISQKIASSFSLDELLVKTVDLIVDEFGYYHAGIFLLDETGRNAVLRAARSPAAKQMLESGHRLEVGSSSIIGWVTVNKEARLASNVTEDPVHLKNELLPETQAELGLPIIAGDLVIGALDVQSTNVNAFDNDTIAMLQTLAGQIASAVQNVRYIEATQVNLQGVNEVYRTSYQIAQAKTNEEIFEAARLVFRRTPNSAILMVAENNNLKLATSAVPSQDDELSELPGWLGVRPEEIFDLIENKITVVEVAKTKKRSTPPS